MRRMMALLTGVTLAGAMIASPVAVAQGRGQGGASWQTQTTGSTQAMPMGRGQGGSGRGLGPCGGTGTTVGQAESGACLGQATGGGRQGPQRAMMGSSNGGNGQRGATMQPRMGPPSQ